LIRKKKKKKKKVSTPQQTATMAQPSPPAAPSQTQLLQDPQDHYELKKVLGRGSFGAVYVAVRKADNEEVAVKRLEVNRRRNKRCCVVYVVLLCSLARVVVLRWGCFLFFFFFFFLFVWGNVPCALSLCRDRGRDIRCTLHANDAVDC
jgi:serine/threonine protein kinase